MGFRLRLVSLVVIMSVFAVASFADATTTYFTPGYDNGDHGYGWGGDAMDYPDDGECQTYMDAWWAPSTAWAWVGSQLTLTSTKSVSMDAELILQAYMSMNVGGSGTLEIYFLCINKATMAIVWSVRVYQWYEGPGGSETWTYEDISEDIRLSDFPKSTNAGTYYFAVDFCVTGQWGARFQYSSSSTNRAVLHVDEIAVSY